jgi:hypothetical protein
MHQIYVSNRSYLFQLYLYFVLISYFAYDKSSVKTDEFQYKLCVKYNYTALTQAKKSANAFG